MSPLENSSLKSRVQTSLMWLAGTNATGQAISWVISIVVIRILSPDDYGLMGMVGVYIGFIILFNEMGLGDALIQKKDLTDEDISNVAWVIIILNVVLYVLSVFVAPMISLFFNEPRLSDLIRISAITLILKCIGVVPYHLMTRKLMFKKRSQYELIGNVLGSISTLGMALSGLGVWSLVYGNVVCQLAQNLLFVFSYPWKPRFSLSLEKTKGIVGFGFRVVTARFLWYLWSNGDFLIAGKVLGKTLLGYYAVAFQIASLPIDKIVSMIGQVALPAYSEIQGDNQLLKRYYLKVVRMTAFITFPALMGIFLLADDGVRLFLSDKWGTSILPLKILCFVSIFRGINAMNNPLLIAKGNPGIAMTNNLLMAVALITAFYIGSQYGLVGLSYSWFVFPFVFIFTTYRTVKLVRLTLIDYYNAMKHQLVGTFFMVVTVTMVQKALPGTMGYALNIVIYSVLGSISYLIYYYLFNREMFSETASFIRRS